MIKIKRTIARNRPSDVDDIRNVKIALLSTGHYETPSYGFTQYPDEELFNAVQRYQSENNLKVDATITPNGETLKSINQKLSKTPSPLAKSPSTWCLKCGAPHGGSQGDLCPDCSIKQ